MSWRGHECTHIMRMKHHNVGYTVYDLLLFHFPDTKDYICTDVMTDEDYHKLSESDKRQVKKIIWYLRHYPKKGRRPAVPDEVNYIFRKYVG